MLVTTNFRKHVWSCRKKEGRKTNWQSKENNKIDPNLEKEATVFKIYYLELRMWDQQKTCCRRNAPFPCPSWQTLPPDSVSSAPGRLPKDLSLRRCSEYLGVQCLREKGHCQGLMQLRHTTNNKELLLIGKNAVRFGLSFWR